jgi:SAM-dependent methyltransferase
MKIKVLNVAPAHISYNPKENEEVTTIDFNKAIKPNILHDLTKYPYPIKSHSFDKIYASHIIEHLPNTVRTMEEFYRILRSNGTLIIRVPHFSSRSSWIDPTHYRCFSFSSFDYFDKSNKDPLMYTYGKCNFKIMKVELHYTRPDVAHSVITKAITKLFNFIANKNPSFFERVWCYWVGGFSEIYLEMIKK